MAVLLTLVVTRADVGFTWLVLKLCGCATTVLRANWALLQSR